MSLLSIIESFRVRLDSLYYHAVCHRFASIGNGVYIGRLAQLVGPQHIHISDGVSIGRGSFLLAVDKYQGQDFSPSINLGREVVIGPSFHITSINDISIGDHTLIGKWVTITDNSHGSTDSLSTITPPISRPLKSKGKVEIGSNVWIGDKATILPGVTIGNGAIVGANAVITHDVPPYCIAVGNPAKIIERQRK